MAWTQVARAATDWGSIVRPATVWTVVDRTPPTPIPANALTFGGQVLTFGGRILTFG